MTRLALVTGTSTGIGRAIAIHLAQRGFEVLAGVRKPEDVPPGLEPIVLDVTSEDHIAAAAERVGGTLHALVNNAGIAVNGPVEIVPVEQWRRQFEVNLIGPVAVTRALLPALLNARGRIVNISSISGRVAWPLISPYTASKFALEAVTDALRREVGPHGVHVVSVEPGGIATPVWDKSRAEGERMLAAMPADARRRYDAQIAGIVELAERLARNGLPPEAVAAVVGDALTARRPRPLRDRPRGQGTGRALPPAAGPRVRRAGRPHARFRRQTTRARVSRSAISSRTCARRRAAARMTAGSRTSSGSSPPAATSSAPAGRRITSASTRPAQAGFTTPWWATSS